MQSAAIEKGAVNGPLGDQIAELAAKGKITVDLKEWADVVRWVGNDAAHPGGQPVTREDAEEVLKLAEQFLHVLYVAPAMAKKLRTKKGK
jgi:predicted ATP-dependent protease